MIVSGRVGYGVRGSCVGVFLRGVRVVLLRDRRSRLYARLLPLAFSPNLPLYVALGAVAMIIVGQINGFYSPMEAVEAVDWNVIFLLAAMMTIVSIMIPTGGFNWMAYKIAAMSKGNLFLMLVLLGTAVTVLSLLLDNVTTVVIFGPLIILIARAQKISPIPYLLALIRRHVAKPIAQLLSAICRQFSIALVVVANSRTLPRRKALKLLVSIANCCSLVVIEIAPASETIFGR